MTWGGGVIFWKEGLNGFALTIIRWGCSTCGEEKERAEKKKNGDFALCFEGM